MIEQLMDILGAQSEKMKEQSEKVKQQAQDAGPNTSEYLYIQEQSVAVQAIESHLNQIANIEAKFRHKFPTSSIDIQELTHELLGLKRRFRSELGKDL